MTPLPSVLLTGETPGPDATIPPGVAVIPRLRIETVAGMWEALGLKCQVWMTSFPDSAGLFGDLHCELHDDAGNVDYWAEADYWTPRGIQYISMTVLRDDGPTVEDGAVAWLLPLSTRAFFGDAAGAWVEERLADRGCRNYCQKRFDGIVLTLDVGVGGAAGVQAEAAP